MRRSYSFSDVILSGGAPDRGLFVPADDLPEITVGELQRLVPLDYRERALRILERLLHPSDVYPSLLRQYAQTAYNTGQLRAQDGNTWRPQKLFIKHKILCYCAYYYYYY